MNLIDQLRARAAGQDPKIECTPDEAAALVAAWGLVEHEAAAKECAEKIVAIEPGIHEEVMPEEQAAIDAQQSTLNKRRQEAYAAAKVSLATFRAARLKAEKGKA